MTDNSLFAALDEASINYNLRFSDRNVPYTGFQWNVSGALENPSVFKRIFGKKSEGTAITALLEDGILKLTAHNVRTKADPVAVLKKGSALPVGLAYVSPDDGAVEISLRLHIGASALNPDIFVALLNYLDSVRKSLEGGDNHVCRTRFSDVPDHQGQDIGSALAKHGHQTQPINRGAIVDLALGVELSSSNWLRN